jgi:hypothetical protein
MIRQAEKYRNIAANYDHMALAINDQGLRWVYLDFAQQWREMAQQAETVDDLDRPKLSGRWKDANIIS